MQKDKVDVKEIINSLWIIFDFQRARLRDGSETESTESIVMDLAHALGFSGNTLYMQAKREDYEYYMKIQ